MLNRSGRIERRRPRRFRIVASAALLAGIIGGLPADAGSSVVDLGRWTTLTGSRTGYVPVRLTRAVHVASGVRPAVKVTGGGTLRAVVLVSDLPGLDAPSLVIPRLPAASTRDLDYRFGGADPVTDVSIGITRRLPPGRYRLYLVTEGPVSVRFELPGLTGAERRTSPHKPTGHRWRSTETPAVNGVVPPVFAAGFDDELKSPGTFFWAQYKVGPADLSSSSSLCLYEEGAVSPALHSVPGCVGGSGVHLVTGANMPTAMIDWSTGAHRAPGPLGLGGYFAGAASLTASGMVALWLDG